MGTQVGIADRVVHWGWRLRKRRAQLANAIGRPFTYRHPVLGRFVYHPFDDLSRWVLLYDFETPELRFAMHHALRGGTILDVGANIGVFTVACSRAAGDRGRVIALEPSPTTFAKLQLTCAWLGLANVELLPIAAARENGRARFISTGVHELRQHLADARNTGSASIDVDTRRLDDVCGDRVEAVTLVKIDVEGHEVSVLEGAQRILGGRRASLIVEFYPAGLASADASAAQLWELLQSTHECIAVLRGDGSHQPPRLASIMALQAQDAFNTLWVPRRSLAA